jgi:hypothetical protein
MSALSEPGSSDSDPALAHRAAPDTAAKPTIAPAPQPAVTATPQMRRLPTGPLLFWLMLQVGALAMAAGRIPLAARYPITGERFALDLLMAVQIGFAALLFPWLLRDFAAAVMAIASCWPTLALAVMLSALKPGTLLIAGGFVTLWLACLTAWRFALASEKSQMIGTSIAAIWAIGGPVVWYLRAEFNSPMQGTSNAGPFFGPLTGAFSQIDGSGSRSSDWVLLALVFILGLAFGGIRQYHQTPKAVHARADADPAALSDQRD